MRSDVLDKALKLGSENVRLAQTERDLIILMAHISLGIIGKNDLAELIPAKVRSLFLSKIEPFLDSNSSRYRPRALIIVFHMLGVHDVTIAEFVRYTPRAARRIIYRFNHGDYEWLFGIPRPKRKWMRLDLRAELFTVMHSPPSTFDINRTTWTIDLLHDVLGERGIKIGKNTISKMIKAAGYNFIKTREVLTSNDPDYRDKLEKITRTLRRLKPTDRFFSIDEYGPFSVRERGGRRRVLRGEKPTIPQYQDSKGYLIVTAALELTRNQITHFYSKKKDTQEMIKLLHLLLDKYWDCGRLYFSWDAASWHSSRRFLAEVKRINSRTYRSTYQTPVVKLMPLPARAQFLNVIESVFSGLSQSIVHNSNYESLDAAKKAIDRYFNERNDFFRKNPKKAGNKIWGEEQVPSYFSVSHNCKDPRFISLSTIT